MMLRLRIVAHSVSFDRSAFTDDKQNKHRHSIGSTKLGKQTWLERFAALRHLVPEPRAITLHEPSWSFLVITKPAEGLHAITTLPDETALDELACTCYDSVLMILRLAGLRQTRKLLEHGIRNCRCKVFVGHMGPKQLPHTSSCI